MSATKTPAKTLAVTVRRAIPAPRFEVFDAWLDPKVPGTIWNAAEEFIVETKVDGLFYWRLKGTAHYGRFTVIERPDRIQHTWVSPNTSGEESMVTVTFEEHGGETLMTLVHSDLPDTEAARGHENGWNYFVGVFREQFGDSSRMAYRWEDAHPPAAN